MAPNPARRPPLTMSATPPVKRPHPGVISYLPPPASGGHPLPPASARLPLPLILACATVIPAALAYALATTNETRVLAVIFAALGALVIIARPFWGLLFFVALLYTRPEEMIPALQGMRLPLLISVVTLVSLVFQKLLAREPLTRSPLNAMMTGFGLSVILSAASQGNFSVAILDISRLVILVLLISNLVTSPQRYRALVTALLLFTGYLAAYSIYLFHSGATTHREGIEQAKATGIFSDPNDLAATFVAGLALVLTRVRRAPTLLPRLLYGLVAVVILVAIILANSRGGMLALLALLGGFVFVNTRRKALATIIAVVLGLGVVTFGAGRMTNFDSKEASANSRFWFWANGVQQLQHKPLLGVGYNGFPDVNHGMTAHNSFVLCFAETGLVGYFFWMGCIYYCYRWRGPRPSGGTAPTDTDVATRDATFEAQGAQFALMAYLVAAFWISRTYTPVLYLLFSLPIVQRIAFAPALAAAAKPKPVTPVPSDPKGNIAADWLHIALLCLGSILFIYLLAMRLR